MADTTTVEIRGRGDKWRVYYPNEERLATPFPVYDRDGIFKTSLWCGTDTAGMTEAHFVGTQDEAATFAQFLVPGCRTVFQTVRTKSESLAHAREIRKQRSEADT